MQLIALLTATYRYLSCIRIVIFILEVVRQSLGGTMANSISLPAKAEMKFSNKSKHRPRKGISLMFKTIALVALISCGLMYMYYQENFALGAEQDHRMLKPSLCIVKDAAELADACPTPPPAYMIVPYFIGSMYIFWAIAIICDDFFVPSLEVIGERLDISDDISGATLMAAGGSAPELATSLIGTFTGSDVGFGTIVGSAVFNVLFVIACCVAFTPEKYAPLGLTWWPLARDCTYYIISLIVLSIFFGVISPGQIELWEALSLFSLYLGYCTIMYFNEELQARIAGVKIAPGGEIVSEDLSKDGTEMKKMSDGCEKGEVIMVRRNSLYKASKFRAGFFSLATNNGLSLFDNAGVSVVYKLKGTVNEMFERLDEDKSGSLERNEVETLLKFLFDGTATKITDEEVTTIIKELDLDQDGLVSQEEFSQWFLKSEKRLQFEERKVFDELDPNNVGSISADSFHHLLERLEVSVEMAEVDEAVKEITASSVEDANGEKRITFDQFRVWFEGTSHWKKQKDVAAVVAEEVLGVWGEIRDFPKETISENIMYLVLVPIVLPLACTAGLFDNRIPENKAWCYYQFMMSIAWISGYSYLMVDWIQNIGLICGIPAVVMGLTLLAAGTSVPDLLSSVVVAKAGRGDMAVSSSIGSNIFDVTVGLPVPWILFNVVIGCPVSVGADNLVLSVVILTVMVLMVVLTIMVSGWKMTKNLGIAMMVLYFIFLTQDVLRVFLTSSLKC